MITADQRERRIVQYLLSVHKERIASFRLNRMNRKANTRKLIIQLIDRAIEEYAEELAAAMLEEFAGPRAKREKNDPTTDRLILPGPKKVPVWVRKSGQAAS